MDNTILTIFNVAYGTFSTSNHFVFLKIAEDYLED